MSPTFPNLEELQAAIISARSSPPFPTGKPSLLKKIKSEHPDWSLGLPRLKKVVAELENKIHTDKGLSTSDTSREELGSPNDALKDQLEYQEKSTRYYRIRGRGEYDYGVTFNADMGIFFNIMQTRAMTNAAQRAYALYFMYDHLQHAAVKAGVPKEDLRKQLWDEFGCDPLVAAPPTPRTPPEVALAARREEVARQQYKANSMELKRVMLQDPEGRKYIPVDNQGEPVWDESINGRYVVKVAKLTKGSGLEELETW